MGELSVYDLDGTLRPGYLVEDAIEHGAEAGFIDPTRFKDIRNLNSEELRYFVSSLAMQHRRVFKELIDRVSDEAREKVFPWALESLHEQTVSDTHRLIISHSPDFLVRAFTRGLGSLVHRGYGSYFHTKSLTFSGHAVTRHKPQTAKRYIRTHKLETVAFAAGDTEVDLPLLLMARRSVVVNPTGRLALLAEKHGWEIVQTEKK